MILPPALARAVLRGDKTQHRRPATERLTYETGVRYPVLSYTLRHDPNLGRNRREQQLVCRIVVHEVRREPLAEITEEDARAEGFKSRREFLDAWWDRWRWGENSGRDVWVVEFQRDPTEVPRFLAPLGGSSDYTTSPHRALDDAEALGEAELRALADENRERFEQHLGLERAEREARSLEDRLAAVRELAARRGIDLTRKLRSIERRIESAERDVGRGNDG